MKKYLLLLILLSGCVSHRPERFDNIIANHRSVKHLFDRSAGLKILGNHWLGMTKNDDATGYWNGIGMFLLSK